MKSLVLCFVSVSSALLSQDFEADIRPLLREHCLECHGEKKNKADLRLDAKIHAFKGGESGSSIVPGKSAESLLYQRIISADEDERMPPKGKALTPEQVAKIKAWIDTGAPWPETAADRAATTDARLSHWAFQPIKRPASPQTIDDFIVAKLSEKQLRLSPAADPRTLIRRLYFDVIGLPPSPKEVGALHDRAFKL